jgi:thiol-disulfide isomerase/thioredoxin
MIDVILYGRNECHLCDEVKADLESLQKNYPHRVIEIDIDTEHNLQKKYTHLIPVVKIGPYELKAPFNRTELQVTLGAALRGLEQDAEMDKEMASAYRGALTWTKPDAFSFWLSNKYLLLMNLVVFLYVGLPFLAPIFMRIGAELPATAIYRVYGLTCHQLAFRSWFLFGDQFVYPRAAAGEEGLVPFGQASGIN